MLYAFETNGKDNILYDFQFHIKEAILFQNWWENLESNTIKNRKIRESLVEEIPIGSIEFVLEHYRRHYHYNIKPINIPTSLLKEEYLKRNIEFIYSKESLNEKLENIKTEKIFIKECNKFKGITDIIKKEDITKYVKYLPLIVSEEIEIISEYRVFVYRGEIVDIRRYLGDYKTIPDFKLIEKIVKNFVDSPNSYTLDVGVNNTETFIIELHDFFSCGFYGFNDNKKILSMINASDQELKRKINQELKIKEER